MVLLTECFPTQKKVLVSYFDKFKNGELNAEDVIEVSSTRIQKEIAQEVDKNDDFDASERINNQGEGNHIKIKSNKKPHSLKNFNKFICRTNKHLDQIIENQKKIDFVHDIVEKIREPLNETEQFKIAEIIADATKQSQNCHDVEDDSDSDTENESVEHKDSCEVIVQEQKCDKIEVIENPQQKRKKTNKKSIIKVSNEKDHADDKIFFPKYKQKHQRASAEDDPVSSYKKPLKSLKLNTSITKAKTIKTTQASPSSSYSLSKDNKIYSCSIKYNKTLSSSLKESVYQPVEISKVELELELPKPNNVPKSMLINHTTTDGRNLNSLVAPMTTLTHTRSARMSPLSKIPSHKNEKQYKSARSTYDRKANIASSNIFKTPFQPRPTSNEMFQKNCKYPDKIKQNNKIFADLKRNFFTSIDNKILMSKITPLSLYTKLYNGKKSNMSPLGSTKNLNAVL